VRGTNTGWFPALRCRVGRCWVTLVRLASDADASSLLKPLPLHQMMRAKQNVMVAKSRQVAERMEYNCF